MTQALVARFGTVGEAEMARSALTAAGIEADVADEQVVAIDWLYSNAVGGVKLFVPEVDLERAAEVLQSVAATNVPDDVPVSDVEVREDDSPPVAGADQCPECGSTESTRVQRLAIFAVLSLLMWGVGVVGDQRDLAAAGIIAAALIVLFFPPRRCSACGSRWPDEPEIERPEPEPPPPNASDLVEELCPRCGSPEFHSIDHRRLKALPFLFSLLLVPVLAMWPFVEKQQCDACGFRR